MLKNRAACWSKRWLADDVKREVANDQVETCPRGGGWLSIRYRVRSGLWRQRTYRYGRRGPSRMRVPCTGAATARAHHHQDLIDDVGTWRDPGACGACEGGQEVLLSGGCDNATADIVLVGFGHDGGNGWRCVYRNNSAVPTDVAAQANCLVP